MDSSDTRDAIPRSSAAEVQRSSSSTSALRGNGLLKARMSSPLTHWKNLAFAPESLASRVGDLFWAPVLIDEALMNYDQFREIFPAGIPGKDLWTTHRDVTTFLLEQPRLMRLPETVVHLQTALLPLTALVRLTLQPRRSILHSAQPELLNIFAFASLVAALVLVPGTQSAPSVLATPSLSILRIQGIDLCALLTCVGPPYDSIITPDVLQDTARARSNVAPHIRGLHWSFIRTERFEERFNEICRRIGHSPEAELRRITSVLAACRNLVELSLMFGDEGWFQLAPDLAVDGMDGAPSGRTADLVPPAPYVPPELDISYVLPYCDGTTCFRQLRAFALSTVILKDLNKLFMFITRHPFLRSLSLDDVAYRCDSDWLRFFVVLLKQLPDLEILTLRRLKRPAPASNAFEKEDDAFYATIGAMLSDSVEFAFDADLLPEPESP